MEGNCCLGCWPLDGGAPGSCGGYVGPTGRMLDAALKIEELQVQEVAGKVVRAETKDRTFVVVVAAGHPGVQH